MALTEAEEAESERPKQSLGVSMESEHVREDAEGLGLSLGRKEC